MIIVGYQGIGKTSLSHSNNHFIDLDGFEFKDGEWRRTPASIFHLMFW